MKRNKGVQGILHKVSTSLTRDVGSMIMRPTQLIATAALMLAACVSAHALSLTPEQYSSPDVYSNLLVFSERTGSELYAVDIASKRDAWVWSCGKRSIRTQPTIVDGIAYIWAGNVMKDSRACAVDCKTGKSVWETPAGGWTFSAAVVAGNVVLFSVAAHTDEIWAFDRTTGKRLWKQEGSEFHLVHGDTVLATTDEDTRLALLDTQTGTPLFETALINEKYTETQADSNTNGIAIVGSRGVLLCLDIPRKNVLWRRHTSNQKWIPTLHGDSIYLVAGYPLAEGTRQELQIRSLQDGSIKNRITLTVNDSTYFHPCVFEKTIVIASGGSLIALDRMTFKERWQLNTGCIYNLTKYRDSLFVGGVGPYLWKVEAETGKKTWTYEGR